jgi:hypothetical protein
MKRVKEIFKAAMLIILLSFRLGMLGTLNE